MPDKTGKTIKADVRKTHDGTEKHTRRLRGVRMVSLQHNDTVWLGRPPLYTFYAVKTALSQNY